MDYCIPCNRTLNGAVTCPECGAYDSGMAELSERRDGAPAVGAAMPEVRFNEGPGSSESPLPGPPTPSQDMPADRHDRPSRLKKYAVQSLAAAAFTLLGGMATASVLQQPADPPAASAPEPSPAEPEVRVTDSPASPASPKRVPTHPARQGVRGRDSAGNRRPPPTPSRSVSPVSRPSATTSASPPAQEKPTPRPSSSRRPSPPSRTATPSTRPSASPSGSISASPTSSGSPTGTGETGG